MNVLQAAILGLIQGLAEFLPISSSGHLMLAEKLLGIKEGGLLLTVLLHLGTLIAVFVIFWQDWWAMLKNPFKNRVFWMLVLATLPAVVVALFFEEQIDTLFSGWFLGCSFLITALLLMAAELFSRRSVTGKHASKAADVRQVGVKQALAMGGMQAFAVLPGVSRSGSTMVGGMWAGLNRSTAAKFSFMMSAPAILGSLVFEAKDLFGAEAIAFTGGWLAPLVGIVVAAVSGFFAIRWMMNLVQRVSLKWFALYVAIVGVFVLVDQLFIGRFFEKLF